MAPIFFRRSVGAFLVYDVTNMDSFLALKSWQEQISNNADGKIVVMLLGNKCDLPNKVVTFQMGQEFARENGFGFMEVSAKSDIGIKAAFTSLVTNIYQTKAQTPILPGTTPVADDRGVSVMLKREPAASAE